MDLHKDLLDKDREQISFSDWEKSDIELAKKAINGYCESEFGQEADFSDLHNVSLAHTTVTDYEIPIQVSADLIDCKINYEFIGDFTYKTESYNNYAELADAVYNSTFDDFVSVYDNIGRISLDKYLTNSGYKRQVVGDGSRLAELFVVDSWTDNLCNENPQDKFTIVSNEFADEYLAEVIITGGEFKGRYLNEYSTKPSRETVYSDFSDKIADMAIDRNEAMTEIKNEERNKNRFIDSFGNACWYYDCEPNVIRQFELKILDESSFPLLAKSYYNFKHEFDYEKISGEYAFDFVAEWYKDVMQDDDNDNYYTVDECRKMFADIYEKKNEIIDFVTGNTNNNPLGLSQEEREMIDNELFHKGEENEELDLTQEQNKGRS